MPLMRMRLFVGCLMSVYLCGKVSEAGKTFSQAPEVSPSQSEQEPAAPKTADKLSQLLKAGPKPTWIWGANDNTNYQLSKSFETKAVSARLIATGDNQMVVSLNGVKVASSDTWEQPVEVDVTKQLKQGKNLLTADVRNAGGVAAFILKLVLVDENGKADYILTDKTWVAGTPKAEPVPVRTITELGGGPWRDVFSQAPASGIPSYVFLTQPGFQVEKLFTVPKEELGSWVSIALDDKGRILASDQGNQGLCRITPPPIGSKEDTLVEHLDVKMTSCQGMLSAFGALYCSVNGGPGSGLYRLKDTDGDDQYDSVEKLKSIRGGGEHGPHALRLSPDGKSIYWVAGNHTRPPFDENEDLSNPDYSSRIPTNWGEDLLLPRQWDANGHARGILAPGGWIAKTDPDGKTWEIVSIGYRNTYDMDFNADGELFAYDADMEWDVGSPWYRPTRVVHATSGSEFGWRSGTGKWPTYYPDSLPPVVDIGPGSPVGVSFGYGTKFPEKFQKALYLCDWTFGTMYAIHLTPQGSTYVGEKTEFLSRSPLPLTDVVIGKDGAMYFTVGGRGTQSELYRVTYVGEESTDPVDARDTKFASQREARQRLEKYQHPRFMSERPMTAVQDLVKSMDNEDRFIRYTATIALAARETGITADNVFKELDVDQWISATIGLARNRNQSVSTAELIEALKSIDFGSLNEAQKLNYLRALSLVLIRREVTDQNFKQGFLKELDGYFPTESENLNRELLQMLVYLESPTVVKKAIPLLLEPPKRKDSDLQNLIARNPGYGGAIANMLANQPDLQQYYYAFVLRNAKTGWSLADRMTYFDWFNKARKWSGGASFQKFLTNISDEAYDNATEKERLAVEAAGVRQPYVLAKLPEPKGPGRDWTLADLQAMEPKLKGRNFKNGQTMFAATRCVICHRFAGDGGATGPDLTQLAGRFNLKDLSEAIVDPAKVISDQYKASTVVTSEGKSYTGRIVSESEKSLSILIDPENSSKVIDIPRSDVEDVQPSKVSLMPKDLLKTLNENEVLDLLAYLLSRGDPNHSVFRR